MSRERLTSRTAEDLTAKAGKQVQAEGSKIDNDVYDMNNTGHAKQQPKVDSYAKGDPEAWAEGVNKTNPAKDDKRDEMNVPELIDKHAAREAVASVKRLEDKAVRCIVASQRILPGAPDDMIQDQAADFMAMPEAALNATLARQEKLAKMISAAAEEKDDDKEDKDEKKEDDKKEDDKDEKKEDDKEEKKEDDKDDKKSKGEDFAAKMKALRDKKATLEAEIAACEKEEEAGKCEKEEEAAAKEPVEEKKEEEAAAAVEEKKEDEEEASSKEAGSLLDVIFSEVTASDSKKGAAKLSGMVKKQASEQVNDLSSMWRSDPDVSTYFG